jgi:hypothetical protein
VYKKTMSTTQKLSIKGLKVGKDQHELLAETVRELVGDAGKVEVKGKGAKGLPIRSRHAVSANSKFADIRIRFHGAEADVGIYVESDGAINMAWDGYVVRGNNTLKEKFEGRADRRTFEQNLNAMFIAKTFEQTCQDKGMFTSGVKRVTLKGQKKGQFELEVDTGGFGTLGGFGENKKANTLGGTIGGGL